MEKVVSFGFALCLFSPIITSHQKKLMSAAMMPCCCTLYFLYTYLFFMYNGMHNMGKMKHKNDNIITQFGEKEHPQHKRERVEKVCCLSVSLSLFLIM